MKVIRWQEASLESSNGFYKGSHATAVMQDIKLAPAKTEMREKLPRNKISYQTIRGALAQGVPDHKCAEAIHGHASRACLLSDINFCKAPDCAKRVQQINKNIAIKPAEPKQVQIEGLCVWEG
jgi:hypothetical protein